MNILEKITYKISARNRHGKYDLFLDLIKPEKQETIIDVGVNNREYSATDNYLEKHYSCLERITAVSPESLDEFSKRYPQVTLIVADGRSLPFEDNQFDIGYSNAVLEHVGDSDDQLSFLQELYRVSQRGYLTTPNKYFPIEIHSRLPLLHLLLPKEWFDKVLRLIGKGWAAGDYMHLLGRRQLENLIRRSEITDFHIYKNKLLGFTLTFTVIWNKARNI